MTGAPRSAYADDDFVIIRGEAVRALGDYQAAGVFQRIAWRCERTGQWRATLADIADEVWLSTKQVRRATTRLREVGWVSGDKSHPLDNTLTWRVTWADTERPPGHIERPAGRMQMPRGADLPITQTETNYGDTGSAEPTATDAERLARFAAALDDAALSDVDPADVWEGMVADGIRHPDHFVASLANADAYVLTGYLSSRGFA